MDIHVHSIPDSEPWRVDAIEVAKLARARGMRGLVLKSHWEPTATIAYLVRKEVPGIEVFGGIGLSRAVGGINPAAVEEMAKITGGFGRVVWMPTLDAENVVRASNPGNPVRPHLTKRRAAAGGQAGHLGHRQAWVGARDRPLDRPKKVLLLVREGRRQGVQHMVVTHAMSRVPRMTIAQMQAAAQRGRVHRAGLRPYADDSRS